jgi:hypothetical protein
MAPAVNVIRQALRPGRDARESEVEPSGTPANKQPRWGRSPTRQTSSRRPVLTSASGSVPAGAANARR